MKLTPWQKTFPLHAYQIDLFSERVDEALREIKTERLNRLRIRLSLEEALLRLRDRFGQDAEVSAVIASRFGRPFIQIELEGEAFNPLSRTETELEDWNSSLLTAVGLSPRYNYTGQVNVLKLTLPHKGMSPMEKIILENEIAFKSIDEPIEEAREREMEAFKESVRYLRDELGLGVKGR